MFLNCILIAVIVCHHCHDSTVVVFTLSLVHKLSVPFTIQVLIPTNGDVYLGLAADS